jgi:hypothetical protein
MVAPIGELISKCFYDGTLDNSSAPQPVLATVLSPAVTWVTTHGLADREERRVYVHGSMSYANPAEAAEVLRLLRRIHDRLASPWTKGLPVKRPLRTLVLSPYRGQVAEIERRISPHRVGLNELEIEVNSVDAAQGREADLVFVSLARSNLNHDLGFLRSESRINVALSRARYGLVVVGDAELCEATPGPLARVIDYIRHTPADCGIEDART